MISSHMLRSVAVCAFLDLRIPSGSGKITEKMLRTHQVGIEGFSILEEYQCSLMLFRKVLIFFAV